LPSDRRDSSASAFSLDTKSDPAYCSHRDGLRENAEKALSHPSRTLGDRGMRFRPRSGLASMFSQSEASKGLVTDLILNGFNKT
jgi:hypothetical protein